MHKNGLVMKDACDRDKWQELVKSIYHTKSGQLHLRGRNRIKTEPVRWWWCEWQRWARSRSLATFYSGVVCTRYFFL